MGRAAVAIGVNKTGKLPKLADAAAGARRFAQWAEWQGIQPVVITDEVEKVTLQQIKDAIREIVESDTTEQLIIYFAGHGVNISTCEYWLLSDAPTDTQAAVNVDGSVRLARYCGIPHVVLISDACRTAAEGIQAQQVTGGEIFPNESATVRQKPVDQFYACALGRPAHEIKDPKVTTAEYRGVYTLALLESLFGRHEEVIDWESDKNGYVRPEPLKQHLYEDVTRKITDMELQSEVVQVPDAVIVSTPDAWIAQLDKDKLPDLATRTRRKTQDIRIPADPRELSRARISDALNRPDLGVDVRPQARDGAGPTLEHSLTSAFLKEPIEFGFVTNGAYITEAFAVTSKIESIDSREHGVPYSELRLSAKDCHFSNVLLKLSTGATVLLPAILEFAATLQVEDGELIDVSYEPTVGYRKPEFEARSGDVRELRALAAELTREGVFRLDGPDAFKLARKMQYAKGVDPSLAIYAAYAYDALQELQVLEEMTGYLLRDLGACFFDLAMLAGHLSAPNRPPGYDIMGSSPLLAQGWSQLSARRIVLPSALDGIQAHLLDSPWSSFDERGGEMIRTAMRTGEIT